MKLFRAQIFSALASLLLLARPLAAQTLTRFNAQPAGSRVRLEGTSTVHDWTIEGALIGGSLELDGGFLADPAKARPGKISAKAQVVIPVRSLKSGKDAMDSVMQQAMRQETHPKIEYHLDELTLRETPKAAEGPFLCDSKGELVIAGVTNKIEMPVTLQRADKARLKISGAITVKMTAYQITPPAPKIALGLISTGDDVKISFDWLTVAKP